MTSSLFFEQTAAIRMLALEIADFLNHCQDTITKVLIAPMACECEREIAYTQKSKLKADNPEPKWDNNLHYDEDKQLCFLMAKCYQYTLMQHCVTYHHDPFVENKTSLFEV